MSVKIANLAIYAMIISLICFFSCNQNQETIREISFPIENYGLYSKDLIYTFDIDRISKNGVRKDTIYLLNYASKPWFFNSTQHKIVWVYDENNFFQKTLGTGLYIDEKRIWIQPPREDTTYSILEFSPFPQVNFPLKKEANWINEMDIGANWSNPKWGIIEDYITSISNFVIKGKKELLFKDRRLVCHVIESTSESPLGSGQLISYFNEDIGFIKFEFTTIKGERINFQLVDIKHMENSGLKIPSFRE